MQKSTSLTRPLFQIKAASLAALAFLCADVVHAQMDDKVTESVLQLGLTVVVGSAKVVATSAGTMSPQEAAALGQDMSKLVERYKTHAEGAQFAGSLVRVNNELIITSAQVLATASGVGALPAAAVAAAARYGNDRFATFIAQEGMDQARGVLSSGLQTMSKADRNKFDMAIKDSDFQGAVTLFEQRTKKLSAMENFLQADSPARALVRGFLEQTVQQTTSDALMQAGKAQIKVGQVEKRLAEHIRASNQFSKELKRSVDTLDQRSVELNTKVIQVQKDVQALQEGQTATALQVSVIQDILFDQQPPSVKLALLRSGANPGLTEDQRNVAERALEVEVKKQEILSTASKVVNAAADISTILTNFGIKNKTLSDAVNYGMIATSALSQAFTGNYLGAIASVSGLFGGGGQADPNRAQFERIFAELGAINQKLDTVIEMQKRTLQAIEQLSTQLAEVEKGLQARLDNVEFEVKTVGENVRLQIWENYSACGAAWDNRTSSSRFGFDDAQLRFASAVGLTAYTRTWAADALGCAVHIRLLFSQLRNAVTFGNPLHLQTVIGKLPPETPPPGRYDKPELQRFIDGVHKPSYNLLVANWSRRASQPKASWGASMGAIALLGSPSSTITELLARARKLDAMTEEGPLRACSTTRSLLSDRAKTLLCSDSNKFDPESDSNNEQLASQRFNALLGEPLAREQIRHFVNYAGLVSGPSNFAQGGGNTPVPLTLQQLASAPTPTHPYGRDLLYAALSIVDLSIAQQAMIYGDLTALFVYDELWDKEKGEFKLVQTDSQKWADTILKNPNNPWLATNVTMLILNSVVKPCGSTPSGQTLDCGTSEIGFRSAIGQLTAVKPDGTGLEPVTDGRKAATRELVLGLFKLPESTEVGVDEGQGDRQKRKITLRLAGYTLPLPSVKDWAGRRMIYPPILLERVRDREVLADRYAEYTVLQTFDASSKARLVKAMSEGDGR